MFKELIPSIFKRRDDQHLKYNENILQTYTGKSFVSNYFVLFVRGCFCQRDNILTNKKDTVPGEFNIKCKLFITAGNAKRYPSALYLLNVVVPSDWTILLRPRCFVMRLNTRCSSGFNLQSSLATLFISNRINLGHSGITLSIIIILELVTRLL